MLLAGLATALVLEILLLMGTTLAMDEPDFDRWFLWILGLTLAIILTAVAVVAVGDYSLLQAVT